ncbi:hypothetical protein BY458DRAFT_492564 [Sporodiniella umbellata]|nr:hypothetical protein BY458DRAFT_492564 [Sporodiniella umbellata]
MRAKVTQNKVAFSYIKHTPHSASQFVKQNCFTFQNLLSIPKSTQNVECRNFVQLKSMTRNNSYHGGYTLRRHSLFRFTKKVDSIRLFFNKTRLRIHYATPEGSVSRSYHLFIPKNLIIVGIENKCLLVIHGLQANSCFQEKKAICWAGSSPPSLLRYIFDPCATSAMFWAFHSDITRGRCFSTGQTHSGLMGDGQIIENNTRNQVGESKDPSYTV